MQVVDSNGFLKVRLSGVSDGITIGTTAIASGTVGRVLFEGTGNVVQESANLFWDNTNGRLGIGGSPAVYNLDVKGIGIYRGGLLDLQNTTGNFTLSFYPSAGNIGIINSDILRLGRISNSTVFLQGFASGNVGINTTTDAGYKLDVNGTARVVGPTFAVGDWTSRSTSVYVRALTGGSENRGFYIGVGASNDGNAGSFTYQPTGNLLNIRSPYNSGTVALSFEGNTNSTQFHNTSGIVHSKIVSGTGNWLINTTTDDGFRLDVNGTARVSGAFQVNQSNQVIGDVSFQSGAGGGILRLLATSAGKASGSFYYDGSDVSNSAYGAFGIATSGTYFGVTGSVLFASSKNGTGVQLPMSFGGFNGSWTNWMQIKTNGNILINTTTDAGFRLDVNGTARVVNTLAVNTGNTNGQGVQIGSDSNSGIYLVSGATQFRQYSSAFEFAGLGTNVFLRTDSTRLSTRANYGISLGTYAASTPEPSAILQAVSTTQGFLPPRGSNAQMLAIASPATGLIFFDNTNNKLNCYDGTTWQPCW